MHAHLTVICWVPSVAKALLGHGGGCKTQAAQETAIMINPVMVQMWLIGDGAYEESFLGLWP